jgi:hypothetical protein
MFNVIRYRNKKKRIFKLLFKGEKEETKERRKK